MSSQSHEHGTMQSYVVGFIFSLVFTLIPYYLVVNKTISGTALLLTIMGFAVLQMLIQITFFLHLGRGPKPKWNLVFFVSTIGIILVVVGGSIIIINNLHYNMAPSDQIKKIINDEGIYQVNGVLTGACEGQHANHKVTITNDQVSPLNTFANKCDSLTFNNDDSMNLNIVFGNYPRRDVYAGQSSVTIQKGRSATITLSETGTIRYYDSSQTQLTGDFTVTQ